MTGDLVLRKRTLSGRGVKKKLKMQESKSTTTLALSANAVVLWVSTQQKNNKDLLRISAHSVVFPG